MQLNLANFVNGDVIELDDSIYITVPNCNWCNICISGMDLIKLVLTNHTLALIFILCMYYL